ncbi:MAG TPA: DUF1028 domain-containing protein [Longimicrobiales bacterium]|nr:DUF1028 domain-containing protein [Longimicrobiales bacterium]
MKNIRVLAFLCVATLAVQPLRAQVYEADPPTVATFSIVACDTVNGFLGVAVQSRVVSAGSIVPAAAAGVGAIASQAAANVAYKQQALELLRAGRTPEQVRAQFAASDEGIATRQFAITDARCNVVAHTGERNNSWAGHRVGRGYSVQGNILTGPEVVDAMAAAYEAAEAAGVPFGERLLAAMKAGQNAGGDSRGRQGAGLLIVKEGGGYGGGDDRYADLRVEDHVEPILELERVYRVWMSVFHPADFFLPNGREAIAAPSGPHVCALRDLLAKAGHGTASTGRGACAFDEEVITALKSFQRANGLTVRPALTADVAARLRELAAGGR